MAGINWYNFIKDFSPLIGILIAALAYIHEKNKDKANRLIERLQKEVDLIDTLTLSIEKVDTLLDGLKIDIEEKKFYAFKNINQATPLVIRLKSVVDGVIVFSNKEIIGSIIKNTDLLSQLIADVTGIENYYNSQNDKYNNTKVSIDYEVRNFELKIIEFDMEIKDSKVKYLDYVRGGKNQKKEVLQRHLDYIIKRITQNEEEKTATENFANDRRQSIARNIIDVQTRLRELKDQLSNIKKELLIVPTPWYKIIFIRSN